MLRHALKAGLERVLAVAGPAARVHRALVKEALILAYHNIVPDGERGGADASLHLPQRSFARQLELLVRTHEVVPLDRLLQGAEPGNRRPRAVITFDDGCLGALTAGLAELRRLGVPATFCITPGRLGRHAFWWDRLGLPEQGEVPRRIRSHALGVLRGEHEAIMAWAANEGLPVASVPECATTATETELGHALSVPGITVAAHSWSHANLVALDGATLAMELRRPAEWLQSRWPASLPVVAYPYGLTSSEVSAAAQRVGYQAGLLISGGWLSPTGGTRRFDLPRLNVPAGLSEEGFALRAAGLIGH